MSKTKTPVEQIGDSIEAIRRMRGCVLSSRISEAERQEAFRDAWYLAGIAGILIFEEVTGRKSPVFRSTIEPEITRLGQKYRRHKPVSRWTKLANNSPRQMADFTLSFAREFYDPATGRRRGTTLTHIIGPNQYSVEELQTGNVDLLAPFSTDLVLARFYELYLREMEDIHVDVIPVVVDIYGDQAFLPSLQSDPDAISRVFVDTISPLTRGVTYQAVDCAAKQLNEQ